MAHDLPNWRPQLTSLWIILILSWVYSSPAKLLLVEKIGNSINAYIHINIEAGMEEKPGEGVGEHKQAKNHNKLGSVNE